MEAPVVSGIAFSRNEAQVTITGVPDRPGNGYAVLKNVSESHIVVDMIVMNAPRAGIVDFSFSVPREEYEQAMELARAAAVEIGADDVLGSASVAKISVVGVGMRSHAGVASTMFETLAREGVNVRMVSTSEIKISVLIEEKYLELAVRSLHEAFGLDQEPSGAETVQ